MAGWLAYGSHNLPSRSSNNSHGLFAGVCIYANASSCFGKLVYVCTNSACRIIVIVKLGGGGGVELDDSLESDPFRLLSQLADWPGWIVCSLASQN